MNTNEIILSLNSGKSYAEVQKELENYPLATLLDFIQLKVANLLKDKGVVITKQLLSDIDDILGENYREDYQKYKELTLSNWKNSTISRTNLNEVTKQTTAAIQSRIFLEDEIKKFQEYAYTNLSAQINRNTPMITKTIAFAQNKASLTIPQQAYYEETLIKPLQQSIMFSYPSQNGLADIQMLPEYYQYRILEQQLVRIGNELGSLDVVRKIHESKQDLKTTFDLYKEGTATYKEMIDFLVEKNRRDRKKTVTPVKRIKSTPQIPTYDDSRIIGTKIEKIFHPKEEVDEQIELVIDDFLTNPQGVIDELKKEKCPAHIITHLEGLTGDGILGLTEPEKRKEELRKTFEQFTETIYKKEGNVYLENKETIIDFPKTKPEKIEYDKEGLREYLTEEPALTAEEKAKRLEEAYSTNKLKVHKNSITSEGMSSFKKDKTPDTVKAEGELKISPAYENDPKVAYALSQLRNVYKQIASEMYSGLEKIADTETGKADSEIKEDIKELLKQLRTNKSNTLKRYFPSVDLSKAKTEEIEESRIVFGTQLKKDKMKTKKVNTLGKYFPNADMSKLKAQETEIQTHEIKTKSLTDYFEKQETATKLIYGLTPAQKMFKRLEAKKRRKQDNKEMEEFVKEIEELADESVITPEEEKIMTNHYLKRKYIHTGKTEEIEDNKVSTPYKKQALEFLSKKRNRPVYTEPKSIEQTLDELYSTFTSEYATRDESGETELMQDISILALQLKHFEYFQQKKTKNSIKAKDSKTETLEEIVEDATVTATAPKEIPADRLKYYSELKYENRKELAKKSVAAKDTKTDIKIREIEDYLQKEILYIDETIAKLTKEKQEYLLKTITETEDYSEKQTNTAPAANATAATA